jgi:hypothetical protein
MDGQIRILGPGLHNPAQILRGLLSGIALFLFQRQIMGLGQVYGGLAVSSVIFLV